MAFKKGQSGNPDGRRKGAANKVTTELSFEKYKITNYGITKRTV